MSPDKGEAVAVVIPCYDQARYLAFSVASARAQSHPPAEILIVDDGSTDHTAAVAESLGVPLVRRPNGGVSRARNAGLHAVRAPYVVFLDADDELLADALATGVAVLAASPDAVCAVGRTLAMNASGLLLPEVPLRPVVADPYGAFLAENLVSTPGAAMFRSAALRAIGGFPEDVGPAADYALYLRLARTGRLVDHGRALVRYRHHEAAMSRNRARMLRTTMRVLRGERASLPPGRERDYVRGRRRWREWYGAQILEDLASDWRQRRFRPSRLRDAAALMRYCPGMLGRRVVGRILRAAGWTGPAGGSAR